MIGDRELVYGLLALVWLLLVLWFADHARLCRRFDHQLDELLGQREDPDETQTLDAVDEEVDEPRQDLSVGKHRRARRGRFAGRQPVHAGG